MHYICIIYIYCKIVYMSAMNAFLVFVCCTLSVHTRTLQDKKGMRLGPFAPLLKRCGQKSKRPTSPFFFDRSVSQWWRCFLFKNIIGGNAVLFWAHLITGVIEDQTIQHVWSFEGFPLVWSIVWVGTIRKISFFCSLVFSIIRMLTWGDIPDAALCHIFVAYGWKPTDMWSHNWLF